MGFNATVVICMDQLSSIEADPRFGSDLAHAILKCSGRNIPIYGSHGTMVIEAHQANHLVPVIVGGNTGTVIPAYVGIDPNEKSEDTNVRILKEMARVLGYRVSKIPPPKTKAAQARVIK